MLEPAVGQALDVSDNVSEVEVDDGSLDWTRGVRLGDVVGSQADLSRHADERSAGVEFTATFLARKPGRIVLRLKA